MLTPPPTGASRETLIRCREPFTIGARVAARPTARPDARSTETRGDVDGDDRVALVGVASSTSVDAHGTEMSLDALNGMASLCFRGTIVDLTRSNGMR